MVDKRTRRHVPVPHPLALLLLVGHLCPCAGQPGGSLAGVGRAAFELLQHLTAAAAVGETTTTTTTLHKLAQMIPASPETKRVVGIIATDCEKIPLDVTSQWQRSQCNANATETMELFAFTMTTMHQPSKDRRSREEQMAGDMSAQLMQAKVHSMTERFCSHPECLDGLHMLVGHNSDCFADSICAGLAKAMPFDICRRLVQSSLANSAAAELDSMCVIEPGQNMYCPELNALLMTRHFECWSQMHQPAKGCSPECKAVWHDLRRSFPVCSGYFAQQVVRSQSMASGTFGAAGLQGLGELLTRSHQELCSDLDGEASEASGDRWGMFAEQLRSMAGGLGETAQRSGPLPSFHI